MGFLKHTLKSGEIHQVFRSVKRAHVLREIPPRFAFGACRRCSRIFEVGGKAWIAPGSYQRFSAGMRLPAKTRGALRLVFRRAHVQMCIRLLVPALNEDSAATYNFHVLSARMTTASMTEERTGNSLQAGGILGICSVFFTLHSLCVRHSWHTFLHSYGALQRASPIITLRRAEACGFCSLSRIRTHRPRVWMGYGI